MRRALPATEEDIQMKSRSAIGALIAVAVALAAPATASATIHPLTLGWVCGAASGDPPGQTPGANHSDQSTLRALQATGILTFTANGPVIDLTRPASKFITFDPSTETGTSDHPGFVNCTTH
jgi:hypothetical protein